MLENIMIGFSAVLQPECLLFMVFGVIVGIVIGAIPGLSGSTGIILLLPIIYRIPSHVALVMLCGLFCGSMFGGSVSAIVLNTPGTPSAAATILDGYPLAKQGLAGKAIGTATVASFVGGIISCVCLMLISPQLGKIALQFNAADYFSLAIFGLSMIAASSGKNIFKGLISGAFGLLIATIGIDPILGSSRFTFGSYHLMNGLPLLAVLIGVFAISEVFEQAGVKDKSSESPKQEVKNIIPKFKEVLSYLKVTIVGGIIGVLIGIIPGTGGSISAFLSYNLAQKMSKHPELFGKGSLEGIAAVESSNNGTTGGALIPMLTLGIPGDVVTSTMLGALVLIGVNPGPMLFTQNVKIVYSIFVGMFVIQFLMLFFGLAFAKIAPNILKISKSILMPIVIVLCIVGAFSLSNQIYHVFVALCFGLVGLYMKKNGYPGAPLILGVILGPMAEENLNRALQVTKNDWTILFTRPISCGFLVVSTIYILSQVYSLYKSNKRSKSNAE